MSVGEGQQRTEERMWGVGIRQGRPRQDMEPEWKEETLPTYTCHLVPTLCHDMCVYTHIHMNKYNIDKRTYLSFIRNKSMEDLRLELKLNVNSLPCGHCDHWCQSRLYTSQPWWHSHRDWQHSYCKPSCGGCSNSNWRRSGKDGWLHFTHSSERKDHIRRSGGDSALGLVFTLSHCKEHTHTGMQKPSHDAQANFVICWFWSPLFVTETPFKN